jgi:hypothetical protein
VRLRQRAPSRGGAAPIEKVWRRLRAAKFGNSYPVPVNPCPRKPRKPPVPVNRCPRKP